MGRSRGGPTTKIHALVDAEGRPVRLKPTPGQTGDAPLGTEFVGDLDAGAILIADRACDTNPIREGAAARSVWANIPPRVIRKQAFSFSPWVHRQRNLVERGRPLSRTDGGRGLAQPYQAVPRSRHALCP